MNTDTHSVQDSTVLIEPGQKSGFAKRLEALSKKAKSFGLAPVVIRSVTNVLYERRTEQIGQLRIPMKSATSYDSNPPVCPIQTCH